MTTMWCVRACDAASQQYLEEETGCGQADCSIMPGACKLHGPAAHCALAFLLDDALRSAGGNITYTKRKITIDWCPDHVVCRTRSAHEGAPSGMLFNELKCQEFIFWMVAALGSCHSRPTSSSGVYVQPRRGTTMRQGWSWHATQLGRT